MDWVKAVVAEATEAPGQAAALALHEVAEPVELALAVGHSAPLLSQRHSAGTARRRSSTHVAGMHMYHTQSEVSLSCLGYYYKLLSSLSSDRKSVV